MATSLTRRSTDHETIREWVEQRDGRPVSIQGTEKNSETAGLLRIDFPGGATDPPLEPISWEAFFEKFDEAGLAMIYQEESASGKMSRFCKFVQREDDEDDMDYEDMDDEDEVEDE